MALPTYVINFDELVEIIAQGANIEIDTSSIENMLQEYFPQLLELLSKLGGQQYIGGTQKIKGFSTKGEAIFFTSDKDIIITGISFSQSNFDGECDVRWRMNIRSGEEEITLLDGVYAKDCLQHKYFERGFPAAVGYEIIIQPEGTQPETTYWFDLEYIYDFTRTDNGLT